MKQIKLSKMFVHHLCKEDIDYQFAQFASICLIDDLLNIVFICIRNAVNVWIKTVYVRNFK